MAKDLDALIESLLEEVALRGDQGKSSYSHLPDLHIDKHVRRRSWLATRATVRLLPKTAVLILRKMKHC